MGDGRSQAGPFGDASLAKRGPDPLEYEALCERCAGDWRPGGPAPIPEDFPAASDRLSERSQPGRAPMDGGGPDIDPEASTEGKPV